MESFDSSLKGSMLNSIRFRNENFNFSRLVRGEWDYRSFVDPYNRLYLVSGGEGTVVCENEHMTLQPGMLYLIPGDKVIDLYTNDYVEKFWLNFTLELFPGYDCCRALPRLISQPFDPPLLQELKTHAAGDDPLSMLDLHNTLLRIILNVIRPYQDVLEQEMNVMVRYRPLFAWLEEHCRADVTVQNMANQAGVSPSVLRKDFRSGCGMGPKEYLRQRILDKGRSLLCFSELNVSQIAQELGFEDAAYFSRFFRLKTGQTPGEYRKKYASS